MRRSRLVITSSVLLVAVVAVWLFRDWGAVGGGVSGEVTSPIPPPAQPPSAASVQPTGERSNPDSPPARPDVEEPAPPATESTAVRLLFSSPVAFGGPLTLLTVGSERLQRQIDPPAAAESGVFESLIALRDIDPNDGLAFLAWSERILPIGGRIVFRDGTIQVAWYPDLISSRLQTAPWVVAALEARGVGRALDLAVPELCHIDHESNTIRIPVRASATLEIRAECGVGLPIDIPGGVEVVVGFESASRNQHPTPAARLHRDTAPTWPPLVWRVAVPANALVHARIGQLPEGATTDLPAVPLTVLPGAVHVITIRRPDTASLLVNVRSESGSPLTEAIVLAFRSDGKDSISAAATETPGTYALTLESYHAGICGSCAGFDDALATVQVPTLAREVTLTLAPALHPLTFSVLFPEELAAGSTATLEGVASFSLTGRRDLGAIQVPGRTVRQPVSLTVPRSEHVVNVSGRAGVTLTGPGFVAVLANRVRGDVTSHHEFLAWRVSELTVETVGPTGQPLPEGWTATVAFHRQWAQIQECHIEDTNQVFSLGPGTNVVQLPSGTWSASAIGSDQAWAEAEVGTLPGVERVVLVFDRNAVDSELQVVDPTGEFSARRTVVTSRLGPPSAIARLRRSLMDREAHLADAVKIEGPGAATERRAQLPPRWLPVDEDGWTGHSGIVASDGRVALPKTGQIEWHAISPIGNFAVLDVDWERQVATRRFSTESTVVKFEPDWSAWDSEGEPTARPVAESVRIWIRESLGGTEGEGLLFACLTVKADGGWRGQVSGLPPGKYTARYVTTPPRDPNKPSLKFDFRWEAVSNFTVQEHGTLVARIPVPKLVKPPAKD